MRFWTIEADGGTIGCELSKKAAKATAESYGYTADDYTLTWVDIEVNAENVRRLLGNLGGYAKNSGE